MSRSLAAAFGAVAVLSVIALGPVAGAEPELEKYAGIASAAGLSCQEGQDPRSHFSCELGDGTTPRVLSATGTDNLDGSYHFSVARYAHPDALAPAESDVLAIMQDFIELSLATDAEAIAWLAEMNAGPQAEGYLPQGDWSLSWHADASIVQFAMVYYVTGQDQPSPAAPSLTEPPTAPLQPGELDPCDLLTEAEVEAVTGLDAEPGVRKQVENTNLIVCGFGTEPWEVQIDITPGITLETLVESMASRQDAGDLTQPEPVSGLGDGAWWVHCPECSLTMGNSLSVASDGVVLRVTFGYLTLESGEQLEANHAVHRDQAIEMARLILPRLTQAVAAGPGEEVPEAPAAPAPAPAAPADRPFAASVPKPAEVSTDPVVLLQSAALAALLVFLMPFPSQLFNSTLETHEDEVRRWLRLDRIGAAVGSFGAFWASWPGVALFTLLAAVLYGFLDPGFGFSLGSLATFLGMLVGIVLVTAAFAVPVVLAHRRLGDRWQLKVVPVSLLIGVACVLLSRLTGFQPGYLYGLLIGLAFARELSAAEEGRATAIGAVVMLAVAFVAWLGLGALPEGEGFGLVVLRTSLAALMVAGLEGVVFGLLPMRFLPGEPLYAWNRILWGALLAVGAFAFFHILINPASGYLSDSSRTPLFTVLALLVGFSLVSVAFWTWFRFRPSPPAEEPTVT